MKMPGLFVPLDVDYSSDPDIRRAGEAAELMFIRGMTYAKRRRTDGFIPDYDLEVAGAGLKNLRPRVAALVEHDLWQEVDGGWQIRSWTRWNETTAEQASKRDRAAARQRARRERDNSVSHTVEARDSDVTHTPVTPPKRREEKRREVPPSAGDAVAASRVTSLGIPEDTTTAQTIVGEWIDRCAKRPPGDVIGQVGKRVAALLGEGIDPNDIRRGMAAWHGKGLHPSTLPSVVNEVMNRSPTGGRPGDIDWAAAMARAEAREAAAAGGAP